MVSYPAKPEEGSIPASDLLDIGDALQLFRLLQQGLVIRMPGIELSYVSGAGLRGG